MSQRYRRLLSILAVFLFSVSAGAATLTIQVSGSGTTDPAPGSYSRSFNESTNIWALPSPGWKFDHWEEDMGGALNPDAVTIGLLNKTVRAVFTQLPPLTADTALKHFIAEVDRSYQYNLYNTVTSFGYTTYFFSMTSQMWRSAAEVDRPLWQHYLIVTKGWFCGDSAVMLIDGGGNNGTPPSSPDETMGTMSTLTGLTIADLKQCPNDPLRFSDEGGLSRSGDEILAYSFDKFLLTGDYKWNGHLPMAKAAVRAMDTVMQEFCGVDKFIVAGASKRGWATWLTAASDDPRVIGFIPIVIPILNVNAQMQHHWESYGFYAPAVGDYVPFNLFCRLIDGTQRSADWLNIQDPYYYIGESTNYNKPKLIVNASGDQFFMSDAMQYYWSALPGPKHLRTLPNASHGMDEGDAFNDAVLTAFAWAYNVKSNIANPSYSWVVNADRSITLTCAVAPIGGVKLWQATNPNARDFRVESIGTVWTSTDLTWQGTLNSQLQVEYVGYCPPPAQGWTAYFMEADFGANHKYTSEVVINPDTLPFEGTHCVP